MRCGENVLQVCFLAGNLALGATRGRTLKDAMSEGNARICLNQEWFFFSGLCLFFFFLFLCWNTDCCEKRFALSCVFLLVFLCARKVGGSQF